MDQAAIEAHLKLAKRMEQSEKIISTIKPYRRPFKEYFTEFMRLKMHETQFELLNTSLGKSNFQAKTTYITAKKHSSHRKLEDLEKIYLNQMMVNKIHYGKYLLARIIYEPCYSTAIQTLITDENDDIENLSLYNYNNSYNQDPKVLLPLSTRILIKEPYLKPMSSDPKNFFIRVDSPTDIVILFDDLPQTNRFFTSVNLFEEYNREGNVHFVQDEFLEAVRSYTKAIHVKQDPKAYSNRSAAYLRLDNYYAAYQDAESSLKIEKSEKAYFRCGIALYNMRQFEQALAQFKSCLKLNDKNLKAKEELEKTEKRIKETKTGVYDMDYLIKSLDSGCFRKDVADYESDQIEIGDVKGKGKGVIAKNQIKNGTLLMASKAIAISYDSEVLSENCYLISYNFLNKKVDLNSSCKILTNIIHRMKNDPFAANKVYSLYAGPCFNRNETLDESMIDVARVEAIKTFNLFTSTEFKPCKNLIGFKLNELKNDNSGLWIKPSFFNHSCIPNTCRIYFGDFVMIYANKDLNQGEEITLQYCGVEGYEEREKIISHFGFKCECELCELDRADVFLKERERFIKREIGKIKEICLRKGSLTKCEAFVSKLRSLCKGRSKYLNDLEIGLFYLSKSYIVADQLLKSTELLFEIYKISTELNEVLIPFLCMVHAAKIYKKLNRKNDVKKCAKMASDIFSFNKPFFHYLSYNDF